MFLNTCFRLNIEVAGRGKKRGFKELRMVHFAQIEAIKGRSIQFLLILYQETIIIENYGP